MHSFPHKPYVSNRTFRAILLSYGGFSSERWVRNPQGKKLDRARRILDIIVSSKPKVALNPRNHLRLIEGFLEIESVGSNAVCFDDGIDLRGLGEETSWSFLGEETSWPLERLEAFALDRQDSQSVKVGSDLEEKTSTVDARVLSLALSSCTLKRKLPEGIQYHCLSLKSGFVSNLYVGSSLIDFYSKCGELLNAYKVFVEMPERNVVSWTAIITGFAQEWRIDSCLELLSTMRDSGCEPNDFTFASVLSACTGTGALGRGKSFHCQTILIGMVSFVHISNALISMYCKCGTLTEAYQIFTEMYSKDVITWNSMIAGYAHHGLASKAIALFKDMKQEKVKPDGITFLGVLSSCRHAGLVNEARLYFNMMIKYGVKPDLDHYSCLIDLLGRYGLLNEAVEMIKTMPFEANAIVWGSLLACCRVHGNVWTGIRAAEMRLVLRPECAATHIQLANLYASVGLWDKAAMVRKGMKGKGLKSSPGCSWVEIKNQVFNFRAEDTNRDVEIGWIVDCLVLHMRGREYRSRLICNSKSLTHSSETHSFVQFE